MPPRKGYIGKRRGQYFTCQFCGETFYRRPSHIRRGITKTCGKRECISVSAMGANNAFWGKNHSPEMRAELKKKRNSRPPRPPGAKRYGPLKGSYVATAEARAKISVRLKEDWRKNRDKRLAMVAKASETRRLSSHLQGGPRHRLQFTPMQRREWTADECAWCDAKDDLVLDHIFPVMAGGSNRRTNAQTLCRRCNLWKMRYVDRPLVLAILDSKGAELKPTVPENRRAITFAAGNIRY